MILIVFLNLTMCPCSQKYFEKVIRWFFLMFIRQLMDILSLESLKSLTLCSKSMKIDELYFAIKSGNSSCFHLYLTMSPCKIISEVSDKRQLLLRNKIVIIISCRLFTAICKLKFTYLLPSFALFDFLKIVCFCVFVYYHLI